MSNRRYALGAFTALSLAAPVVAKAQDSQFEQSNYVAVYRTKESFDTVVNGRHERRTMPVEHSVNLNVEHRTIPADDYGRKTMVVDIVSLPAAPLMIIQPRDQKYAFLTLESFPVRLHNDVIADSLVTTTGEGGEGRTYFVAPTNCHMSDFRVAQSEAARRSVSTNEPARFDRIQLRMTGLCK